MQAPIEPIITLSMNITGQQADPIIVSYGATALSLLGIPYSDAAIILLMFAVWGVWHWVLMGYNALEAWPDFVNKIKEYLNGKKEE